MCVAPTLAATSSLAGSRSIAMIVSRAGEARAEHAGQPDSAQSQDRHRVARPDARGIDHGPDTGHDGAAEQRRIGERHVLVDDDTLPRSTTAYSAMQESPE